MVRPAHSSKPYRLRSRPQRQQHRGKQQESAERQPHPFLGQRLPENGRAGGVCGRRRSDPRTPCACAEGDRGLRRQDVLLQPQQFHHVVLAQGYRRCCRVPAQLRRSARPRLSQHALRHRCEAELDCQGRGVAGRDPHVVPAGSDRSSAAAGNPAGQRFDCYLVIYFNTARRDGAFARRKEGP